MAYSTTGNMIVSSSTEIGDSSSAEMRKATTQPQNEKLKSNTKVVSFQKECENRVRIIEKATKLSLKDKKKRWVSTEEFTLAKKDCMKVLKEIEYYDDSDDLDDSDDCETSSSSTSVEDRIFFAYRGLEMVDPAAIAKRQRHNVNSIAAVLIEQKEQRQRRGRSTPLKSKDIRKVYKSTVTESAKEAIENAYLDSKAVEEYLQHTMEEVENEHSLLSLAKMKHAGSRSSMKRFHIPRLNGGVFTIDKALQSPLSSISSLSASYRSTR